LNTTLNERKSECTSENLENTKKRRKISSQFMIAFCVQILVVGLFIMGLWQNFLKDYLHKESLKTQILVGEKIIEEIESNLNVAQTLSNTISKIGLNLPKELDLTKLVLVKILNNESSRTFVAGGGYWPEPYSYFKDVERRSFFWSRQEDKSLKYFEDYNDPKGQGYHKEEWYVPTRYQKPGKCYWSKSYVDPYSFVPMVTCSTPVVDESSNAFKGVATIDVMLDGVKDLLKRSLEGTDSYAFVLDRNEKFISFPNEEMARQNVGETEAQKKDFLEFSEFVKRYPDYQELHPALKKMNDSFFKTVLVRHPNLNELAKKLSQESYQINDRDSLLISAGLEADKDHANFMKNLVTTSPLKMTQF
jgi:hypothetical protein